MITQSDKKFMRLALFIARSGLGRVWPNPSVGCVIVDSKQQLILSVARTADGGRPHAEPQALTQAGTLAKGAIVYLTLEPCAHFGNTPPCVQNLINSKVSRVVIGCLDLDPRTAGKSISLLIEAGIDVTVGALEDECRAHHSSFFMRLQNHRPFVTLKAACTQNGTMVAADSQKYITGDLARRHVHLIRSLCDAILVGIGTVLADDPLLTTRLDGYSHKIVRVVLDGNLRIPLNSKLVQSCKTNPLWIFYCHDPHNKQKALMDHGAELFQTTGENIQFILKNLAERGITHLLVEGGASIHKAFIQEGFCDRLLVYRAPAFSGLGEEVFNKQKIQEIQSQFDLPIYKTRLLEQDLLEIYCRKV